MKNIVFILGLTLLLFSCKKDKLGGYSTFTGCPGMYDYRSEPLDLSLYDSIKWYYDTGCWGMEPILPDTSYNDLIVNPNNPYEIAYVERIVSNSGNAYSLYTYNFCTNTKVLLNNAGITGSDRISWSIKNQIFFIQGAAIMRIDSDGGNLTTLFLIYESQKAIYCNPDGTLFIVAYSDAPNKDINKVYTEDGDEVFVLPNQANFLGWYDDSHVLTNFDDKMMKTNVHTGNQEVILSGDYYSYDHASERFLKHQDSSGYYRLQILNEFGGILQTTPYHYGKGVWLRPKFVANNKIISNLESTEFYPDKHTPSCGLKTGYSIVIMDMDGTNVRKVEFPE